MVNSIEYLTTLSLNQFCIETFCCFLTNMKTNQGHKRTCEFCSVLGSDSEYKRDAHADSVHTEFNSRCTHCFFPHRFSLVLSLFFSFLFWNCTVKRLCFFVEYFSPRFRKWCCGALKCQCNCNGKANCFNMHYTPYTIHSTWIAWKAKEMGEKMRKMWLSMSLFLCSICQNSIACHVFSVRCRCIGNMVQILNMYELCTCFWVFFFDLECKMHIANSLFVMNVISVVAHCTHHTSEYFHLVCIETMQC